MINSLKLIAYICIVAISYSKIQMENLLGHVIYIII